MPESHKRGLVKTGHFHDHDLAKQERDVQLPEGKRFASAPMAMKAGQVSFHHALLIHGSGPNTTPNPRRSLAVHLMAGDTVTERAPLPTDI